MVRSDETGSLAQKDPNAMDEDLDKYMGRDPEVHKLSTDTLRPQP